MAMPTGKTQQQILQEAIENLAKKPQVGFHQLYNNATIRSMLNGKHRRPNPTTHRDPAQRANPSTRTYDYTTYKTSITWTVAPPKPPAIPYAGIRAGEIVGYRAWAIRDGQRLGSLAHDFIWEPGAVISGDIGKIAEHDIFGEKHIWGGVYAFADASMDEHTQKCIEAASSMNMPIKQYRSWTFNYGCLYNIWGLATGTISMWGEVIEHECGWRSQFARLRSIDAAYGLVKVEDLRSVYYRTPEGP
jgi:hypothetical protein